MNRMRFWRRLLLLAGLILLLTFRGESTRVSAQSVSVSVQLSNPSCVQVGSACSIQFGGISASGSDPSFSRLEVLVDGKLRVWAGGFFESTAYLTPRMTPAGLKVACGLPGAGGQAGYGKSHLIAVNAYMADGVTSANAAAAVFCPSFEAKSFLPIAKK